MSIRARLWLWYTSLLAVSLLGFGLLLYWLMSAHFADMVDDALRRQAGEIRSLVTIGVLEQEGGDLPSESIRAFLFDSAGRLLWRHGDFDPPDFAAVPKPNRPGKGQFFTTELPEGRRRRHYVVRLDAAPAVGNGLPEAEYLVVSGGYREFEDALRRLRHLLWGGGVLVILVAAGVGSWMAAGALRPIADITNTARLIAASKGFEQQLKVPAKEPDEVGRLAITFNEMLTSLRQAYDRQRQFVADASHELRAPITTLLGNLDLLERWERLSPADREGILQDLRSEAQRMKRLVEDLLILARTDMGEKLRRAPVELDRIALQAFRTFRSRAEGYNFTMGHFEPVVVKGDADRLRELLVELLDNAFRYTPRGGSITVALAAQGADAVLTVRDTGIGIDEQALPYIFDRFYRTDRARSRALGGTGLGLSIVQRIVEQHGGRIEVTSRPGEGTCFAVYLPRWVG